MKKAIYCIIFLMLFLSNCTKKNDVKNEYEKETKEISHEPNLSFSSQYDYKYTVMYVNTGADNLNVRNTPSIDGDKINTLKPLTEVLIIDEDVNIININGIDGKWVLVQILAASDGWTQILTPIKGWVFSGYLEKKKINIFANGDNIEDIMVGDWRILDADNYEKENTIFFMVFCLVKDEYGKRWVYGNYGTEAMDGGAWKMIDDETIELESIVEEEVYSKGYLSDIKFIDNDMITCSLFNRFETMKKLKRNY